MKYLFTFYLGVTVSFISFSQSTFQSTLQTGISLPVNSNAVNSTHAGQGIHFGNHLDYYFGTNKVRFGLGAYIGYLNSLNTDVDYKKIGQGLADKYGFTQGFLSFKESEFKSTHILLGPVASFSSKNWNFNLWAKAGYGLNDPGQYAVQYKEGNLVSNIYVNQAGDNKNGLAYNGGFALQYSISPNVGLQFGASYFGTQTDQVNYNYDREKGTSPLYYTAKNNFIQASIGIALKFMNGKEAMRMKTKSNIKNDRVMAGNNEEDNNAYRQIIKSKSNVKNNRSVEIEADDDPANTVVNKSKSNVKNNRMMNDNTDQLVFLPDKIQVRATRQTQGLNFGERTVQLNSVNNYLTGFAYQTDDAVSIGQCGSNEMGSDPMPGVDVTLSRLEADRKKIYSSRAKTNADGSFSFNNIEPGDYTATVGDDTMYVVVKSDNEDGYKTMDISSGTCSNSIENNVISIDDTMFVEVMPARDVATGMATGRRKHIANIKWAAAKVVAPRDASTGLATGKRMHKPYKVTDTEFDINQQNIIRYDGKVYAEVVNSREASSGMASGSVLITGDVDGDGFDDNAIISPRDASSGLPTGKRMHKPFVITKELDRSSNELVSPRDASSGLPTGKRMHKPFVVTKELDRSSNEIVSPRDASSGLPTGKRMHKPFVVTKELDRSSNELVSPRDASSGLPTGKRMHKPFVVTKEVTIISDDAGGQKQRMHKPIVITREFDADGNELRTYVNVKPGDRDVQAAEQSRTYFETGDKPTQQQFSDAENDVVKNPLYESGGNSGENPLYEPKNSLRVSGSNGIDHAIFIPDNLQVDLQVNTAPVAMQEYTLMPVKWMAPESMNAVTSDKGINEAGMKKGITQSGKGITQSGKGINEAGMKKGINQSGVKKNKVEVKGWNPENKESVTENAAKASINTTRSNIKHVSRITCTDGSCVIECVVEMNGREYDAVITGSFRSLNDSKKSTMNTIR